MTHVRILSYSLGRLTSGQSRFARTLATGLQKNGVEVSVRAVWASPDALSQLNHDGIVTAALRQGQPGSWREHTEILFPRRGLRALAEGATRDGKPDWIVVVSDELVSAGTFLPAELNTAYISNGDFVVLLLNDAFFSDQRVAKNLVATLGSVRVRRNARDARAYKVLFGNSEFTRNFMAYLYGLPFAGVCYPPVDFEQFQPKAPKQSPPFALAVARNLHEQGIRTLHHLARRVPLRVAGGLQVPGATNLGVVGDAELAALYSQATVVVTPVVSEFFGYSVAEALACGTPVSCYSVCGPGELVQPGVNGWTAASEPELVANTVEAVHARVPAFEPEKVRSTASNLRDLEVARRLLEHLSASARSPA